MTETVVGPALLTTDGVIYGLSRPNRHKDVMAHMGAQGLDRAEVVNSAQGFATDAGRWVSREEAWQIAMAAGQVAHPDARPAGALFSEHLW